MHINYDKIFVILILNLLVVHFKEKMVWIHDPLELCCATSVSAKMRRLHTILEKVNSQPSARANLYHSHVILHDFVA